MIIAGDGKARALGTERCNNCQASERGARGERRPTDPEGAVQTVPAGQEGAVQPRRCHGALAASLAESRCARRRPAGEAAASGPAAAGARAAGRTMLALEWSDSTAALRQSRGPPDQESKRRIRANIQSICERGRPS